MKRKEAKKLLIKVFSFASSPVILFADDKVYHTEHKNTMC